MKTNELSSANRQILALHQDALKSLCEQFVNHIEGNFVSHKVVKAFCEAIADEVKKMEKEKEK